MQYTSYYPSPLGRLFLSAKEDGLTSAWFEGQKYFARNLNEETEEKEIPLFKDVKKWLSIYFPEKNRTLPFLCFLPALIFKRKCGKYSVPFPMEKQ